MSLSDCFMLCSHIFSIKNNTETKKLMLQGALYVTHPIRCATSTCPSRGYEFGKLYQQVSTPRVTDTFQPLYG